MKNTVFTMGAILNIAILLSLFIGPVHLQPQARALISPTADRILDRITQAQYKLPTNKYNPDRNTVRPFQFLLQLIPRYLISKDFLTIPYLLFTPKNPSKHFTLQITKESLDNSPFDPSLQTKIVIHGYSVPLSSSSVFFDIKDKLLLEEKCNVILVDWTDYNRDNYLFSAWNAILVGFHLAKFLQLLMDNRNVNATSFHLIGHSLGAQVAAFTGKATPNLGRISGLDAAGPIFQALPSFLSLTYSDALFVDAMHTNGNLLLFGGIGTLRRYGDIDFYPNGGQTQPNCEIGDTYLDTEKENITVDDQPDKISCSHDRAPFLFLESINNSRCHFLSILCDCYENFQAGQCQPGSGSDLGYGYVAEMGFHAMAIPSLDPKSTFFLYTSDVSPYCLSIEQQLQFAISNSTVRYKCDT